MPKKEIRIPSVRFSLWWPALPGDWRAWLPSRGNVLFTLLVVAGLLWASNVGALSLRAPAAASTSTGTIAYQGRLADSGGTPLTGTYNMIFRLYDVATGGVPLWEEQWTGSNGVQVSNGLFNVMLGSLTQIPLDVVTGHDTLWLGIIVGTDDEMTPRVQLGSVPFAVQALTVPDGSITSRKLQPTLEKVTAPSTISLEEEWQTVASTVITVEVPSRVWLTATCDFEARNGALAIGRIAVDDVGLDGSIHAGVHTPGSSNPGSLRETVSNSYVFDLEPGGHTVELRVQLYWGVGSGEAWVTHTGFSYMVVSR